MVYDDGGAVEITTEQEDCPVEDFVDAEEFLENPTEAEVAMGDALGRAIDIDDDEDNGAAFINAIDEMTR